MISTQLSFMSVEEILMDIHTQIGRHGAMLEAISDDVKETKKEAKNTNGRVSKLEIREEGRDTRLGELSTAFLQLKELKEKKPSWFTLDWQKVVLFFGSLATILALAIDKLWRN